MVLHDGFGETLWASDEWDLDEKADLVKDAIANAIDGSGGVPGRRAHRRRPRAVFVRGAHGANGASRRRLVADAPDRCADRGAAAAYVRQILQPAFECLRRELCLRAQLGSRERDLGVRERDLSLMLEMSSNQTATGDADEFDLILKTALEHMGCALAALWVPDKNIGMSMTRSGHPMSQESLQRAKQHLMAWIQLQQRTIIVNQTSKVAGDVAAPFKILACPVRHPSERVMGVLALFNPASAHDFDSYQTRVAELLAKKVTVIIQAQYDASTGLMTRHAFERQAASLLASAAEPEQHCILYLDIDRLHVVNETFGMHVGDDVIASVARVRGPVRRAAGPVGAHFRRPARRAHPERGNRGGHRHRGKASAPRRRPSCRAPVRARSRCRRASASLPWDAPRTRSRMHSRRRRSPARPPRTAAATASRSSRTPIRASSAAIPTSWSSASCARRWRTTASGSMRSPSLPLRGNYGRPRFELFIRMLGERGEIIPPGKFLSAAERYQLMPTVDRWVVRRACELLSDPRRRGGRGYRALRHQPVRAVAAGRDVPAVRRGYDQEFGPFTERAVFRADRDRDGGQPRARAKLSCGRCRIWVVSSRWTISAPG